jgi:CDP-diacylglycerol--glycerol-3-phosphate 3-phosphatidyltransferase
MMTCWIPNSLTLSRIVLLLPILWLLDQGTSFAHWSAFALFVLAGVTDGLDGWAARRLACTSNIGVFLDPLADKILANVLLVFLAGQHPDWIPLWAALLLLVREFAVQGFRSMAPCLGVVIATGQMNKWKLVFQLIAIGTALVGLATESIADVLLPLTWLALGLALFTALWSMFELLWKNHDLWSRQPVPMERR